MYIIIRPMRVMVGGGGGGLHKDERRILERTQNCLNVTP